MVKTHRSTQLFPYCSGGESSVKCFRPSLEMEASKEKRGVVRFLVVRVLRRAIKSKRPGMFSDGIIILHDNARPTLQHPPYSQDLSPCDFHILGDLRKYIHGCRFHSDEKVQEWERL